MYFDQQVFSGKTKRHLTLFYHNSQRKNLFSKKKEIKRPAITILGEVIFWFWNLFMFGGEKHTKWQ